MKRPLLLPLVPLYAAGLALRELRLQRGWEPVRRLRFPVISIGNLSTGGSGKTPLTIALARLLRTRGFQVDVLSRGFGRRSALPLRVDPAGSADQFGDEPLLIALEAGVPVYVASERYDAGRLAESEMAPDNAAQVHLLDDGFQHRQLARDIDVLLLGESDLRDYLLPAGNLREPLTAFQRATAIAVLKDEPEVERFLTGSLVTDRNSGAHWPDSVWRIRRHMRIPQMEGPVLAFCGIARPEQFFAGLEAAGLNLVARNIFPDHHRYGTRDVEALLKIARKANATGLVTTEKDRVRLGGLGNAFAGPLSLRTAELKIEFENQEGITTWLEERLLRAHAASRQS